MYVPNFSFLAVLGVGEKFVVVVVRWLGGEHMATVSNFNEVTLELL